MADATKVMADVIYRELKAMEMNVASKVAAGTHDELGEPLKFRDGNDPHVAVELCMRCGGDRAVCGHDRISIGPARQFYQAGGEADYDADHAALVAYLLSAVRRKDWHAVSDAANDLRVLEASHR